MHDCCSIAFLEVSSARAKYIHTIWETTAAEPSFKIRDIVGIGIKVDRIPTQMRAIHYTQVQESVLAILPVPQPKPHEILIKGILNSKPNILKQPNLILFYS